MAAFFDGLRRHEVANRCWLQRSARLLVELGQRSERALCQTLTLPEFSRYLLPFVALLPSFDFSHLRLATRLECCAGELRLTISPHVSLILKSDAVKHVLDF